MTGLQLRFLLPPRCWNCRCPPPCLGNNRAKFATPLNCSGSYQVWVYLWKLLTVHGESWICSMLQPHRIHRSLGHRLLVVVKYDENALVLLWGPCQWDKFIRPSFETWDSTWPLLVKRSHLFLVINNTFTRIQWSLKPRLSFVIRHDVFTVKISGMV